MNKIPDHNLPKWTTADIENDISLNNVSGIANIARSEAELFRPKPDDTTLTVAETEIIAKGQVYLDTLKESAKTYMKDNENIIQEYKLNTFGAYEIKELNSDYDNKFKNEKQKILSQWQFIKKKLTEKYQDITNKFKTQDESVNRYKQAYNIADDATSASTLDWLKLFAATIFLFSIEIWINRGAIGSVSVGGLNYGLLISIIIASINVYGSSLVGYTVTKHINDNNISQRTFYKSITALYGIFLIYLNWIYAAYREISEKTMAESNDRDLGDKALTTVDIQLRLLEASTPWSVGLSVPSIGLLGLGLLFGVFALYKFYLINDPRPGYGRISSKRNKLKEKLDQMDEELNSEKNKLYEEYNVNKSKMYDDTKKAIESAKTESLKKITNFNTIINKCQDCVKDYKEYRSLCLSGVKHMIDEFRRINKNIQSTSSKWHEPPVWGKEYNVEVTPGDAEYVFENTKVLLMTDDEKEPLLKKYNEIVLNEFNESRDKLVLQLEGFNKEGEINFE